MSYLSFSPENQLTKETIKNKGSVKRAFSEWIIQKYWSDYKKEVRKQKTARSRSRSPSLPLEETKVGIIGGGFAGMYAGLILQSSIESFE